MGMIGGGPGSFIGPIHRMAARMDGESELVCGAFSSDPEKSQQTGQELGLDPARVYGSWKEMLRREADLPLSERMEFVSIVTSNSLHFEQASVALNEGFHIVLDKPLCSNLEEAKELRDLLQKTKLLFCLTHTYSGYPLVREARYQLQNGKLGTIRKIFVEYAQGWLSTPLELSGNKQAAWRTDPVLSGSGGAIADIGTHAFNLVEYICGLKVTGLSAVMQSIVEGRQLDDDCSVFFRMNNGASGVLLATQVAAGEENNLRIRVSGENGSLEWQHRDPNSLQFKFLEKPIETWRAGESYLSSYAKHVSRTPAGHPEGFIEAFANLYRNFTLTLNALLQGTQPAPEWDYPGIEEGYRGMLFVEKAVESSKNNSMWVLMSS